MAQEENIVDINGVSFLDKDTHAIVIQVDRVGLTFYVEEFLDFFKSVEEVKDFLLENPLYTLGVLMGEDKKEIIVPKPDEDEYT